ncbi:MAG: kelch repeat-containing protein [Flavobacteriales bacterium]
MKNILLFIGLSLACYINYAQDWVQLEDYPGLGRNHPITFSIGTDGYVLAGQNENGSYVNDFYKYDTTTDSWTQLPNFPGYPRGYAYGIEHNGKAYVGFGNSNAFDIGPLDDLWEYDPLTEAWTELASCPCGGRLHPAMLEAGGKIFVGLGNNDSGNQDDWWAYDIATDTWAQKADFIAEKRHHPYFFSIDDIAYVGFGHGASIYNDFYKYEPLTDTWTQVSSIPAQGRVAGTQFAYNGKGYALSGDGENHSYLETGEFWQYTPETDSWLSLPVHPGHSKWAPGCFIVGDVLYFTSGFQYDDGNSETLNDLWRFNLDEISGIEVVELETLVYPNPTTDKILLSSPVDYHLFSLKGELVLEGRGSSIEVSQLSKGVYFLNTKTQTFKIIKE